MASNTGKSRVRPPRPGQTSNRRGRRAGNRAGGFTGGARAGRGNKQVDGLSNIELTSASALNDYLTKLEDIGNALSFELAIAGRDLEESLKAMPGMRLIGPAQARVKARIVTRHLIHAADTAAHIRVLATRTRLSYRKHFEGGRSRAKPFDPNK